MSAQTHARCTLSISDETLSALRDELLSEDEAERLQAHAATCAACRERIESFERIGAALRRQRLAGPSARLWADVRAAIIRGERTRASRGIVRLPWRMRDAAPGSPWRGMGGLAAALVVALLFGLLLHGVLVGRSGKTTQVRPTATTQIPTATATPIPTATSMPPLRGEPPAWRQYSLPQGYSLYFPTSTLTVAPSDGNVAYMCDGGGERASPQLARVLVTHDRGAHWSQVSDVATGGTCNQTFIVDQIDPNVLVAGSDQSMSLSTDGGASWRPFSAHLHVSSVGPLLWSGGGTAHAILGTQDATGETLHFAVSTDGLRTWRNIDSGISTDPSTGDTLRQFWVNPVNGHLLAATFYAYWQSTDAGQTWSRVTLLPGDAPVDLVVQQPAGASDWHICSPTVCTTDGGRTWTALPQLVPPLADGSNPGEFALAITPNSSLLAYTTSPNELYSLAPGGTRWEDLGPLPMISQADSYAAYAPAPGTTGTLWALPPGGKGAYNQYYSAPLPAGG
jgi:photosystem II stability/assembly factor-like uncharacterized protein